jgi:hypothetical protein
MELAQVDIIEPQQQRPEAAKEGDDMRKAAALAALILLGSVMAFATGPARIDLVNNSGATVRFLVDSDPARCGDIIPHGTCPEYVSASATHTLTAMAPGYRPISTTITVGEGDVKH